MLQETTKAVSIAINLIGDKTMTDKAKAAIKAAKSQRNWGRYATLRYLNKRGVRIGTFRLACQLEAAKGSS